MNEIIINDGTLVTQVNKNTDDITQLKSNVKWIYQYGGVGGSGNGFGGTTQKWSIYATLDNKVIKNNGQIILDNNIKHNLSISIAKPNGLTYTLKSISYYNGNQLITQKINKKLTSGNYEYTYNNININGNGIGQNNLLIIIDCDDNPDPQSLSCSTICNPFNITTTFQEYKNNTYKNIGNKDSIYVSSIQNLYLTIDYNLYVSSDNIIKLIFENTNLPIINYPENGQLIITERSGVIHFEIDNNAFSNNKYYGINNINLYIEIDDGSETPKIIDISTSCTLIPDGLFLRISPYYATNNLYNNLDYISINKPFNTGLLYLNLSGYYGTPNGRTFNVSCIKTKIGTINDDILNIDNNYTLPIKSDFLISEESNILDTTKNILNLNTLSELTLTKSYLNIGEPGIYALSFLISSEENSQIILSDNIYVYYICVLASQNTAHWIEDIEFEQLSSIVDSQGNIHNTLNSFTGAISEQYSYHYRFGNDITENILPYLRKYGSYITVNSNNETDIDLFNITPNGGALEQYIINIGIQYSTVNDFNDPIFTLYGNNPSYNIVFYQNQIKLYNSILDIYLPLSDSYDSNDPTKYHLISLVRQKMNNSSSCYSYIFYIDGIQETALGGAWKEGIAYTGIKLHKSNYSINLIDVTNITYEINDEYNNQVYQLDIRDHIIAEYYMQYATNIFGNEINSQITKSIDTLNDSKHFIFEDNVIKVDGGLPILTEIKKSIPEVQMMVLDFSNESSYNTKQDFFNNFFFIDASNNKKKIGFSGLYYNYFDEDDIISIPNGYWSIEHQGSSTLTYKIKNLELESNTLDSGDNASMYIFSPNFKNITDSMTDDEKKNTYMTSFLPEVSYTLKADEMDSSHCNNTSVGLFVNKNTTKFADVQNLATVSSSKYKNYIKNCLTGYPCLLFIQLKNNETNTKELYYLGIYNFNLGRSSEFNLGYKDTNILDNIKAYNKETNSSYEESGLRDGFNLYNIQVSAIDKQNQNICIAEIQGNDSRFDFSQYDSTILFDQSVGNQIDNYFMLGDLVPKYTDPTLQSNQKSLLSDFIKSITFAGGFIFDTLGKGMSNNIEDEYGYQEGFGYKTAIENYPQLSKNMVPNYRYQSKRTLNGNTNTYTYEIIRDAIAEDLQKAICETRDEYGNLQHLPTLDYISILEYYVICMAFGLVDSVQKNLNIKSWTADQVNTLGARFYVAFYDMDTSNGKTNSGGQSNRYAFTDYWVTLHNSSAQLEQSQIFRDFFPVTSEGDTINNKPGYDTPSSYLLAIAKYASLFGVNNLIDGIGEATENICPENFWAYLRNSEGKNGSGELRNAKYFIDNYFYVNMNKIPIQFISLNYRFKYLQLSENSFDSSTLDKFGGLGKYYAEDWLNDRFHILDAYFNLQQENKQVLKYNYDELNHTNIETLTNLDSVTEVVVYNTQPLSYSSNTNKNVPEGYLVDTTNSDIYVINHIFNTNSGAQIKGSMKPFNISAFDMAPLIIKGTNNTIVGSYIVPDSTQTYTINIHKESNENWMFGGSQLWTKIDNILPFINSNDSFYVHSDKLRSISGNQGTCDKWYIECQSLQELLLRGSNYGGSLTIDCKLSNPNAKYWQNIKNIDISGSKIQLSIDNAVVNKVICNNVNIDKYELSIVNCKLITDFKYNNLIARKLTFTPIHTKNFELSNCDIKEVKLSPKYLDSTITIESITNLQNITISANEEGTIDTLIINNCPSLTNIDIAISPYNNLSKGIKNLSITNCNFKKLTNTSDQLIYIENKQIGYDYENNPIYLRILHLEKLLGLKSLSLASSLGFDIVILPNNDIELLYKAFYNTDLIYIDFEDKQNNNHKLILCDNGNGSKESDCSIFYNSQFSLHSSYTTGENTDLYFSVKNNKFTSLKYLFYINRSSNIMNVHNGLPNINYNDTRKFINNLENKEKVTSFEYAFHRQTKISAYYDSIDNKYYDSKEKNYELTTSNKISFAGYSYLNNISQMFEHTNINFIDNIIFGTGCAESAESLDISNFISYKILTHMHFNALDNIKNKIITFLFYGKDDENQERLRINGGNNIGIYDNNGLLNEVNVHDLLFNNQKSKIKWLCGFNLNNLILDINNLFTEKEESIELLEHIFTNLNQLINKSNLSDITSFTLSPLKNLNTISDSFVSTKLANINLVDTNKLIDILSYLNWNEQFLALQNSIKTSNIFNFYKKVDLYNDQTKWENLWKFGNINDEININYLLSRCIFYTESSEEQPIIIPNTANNNIKNVTGLFAESTCYHNGIETGILLSDNSLDKLFNVIYINNLFDSSKLNGLNNYPIPSLLLSKLTKLLQAKYAFANTIILGNHKTYNNNNSKDIIYIKSLVSSSCRNYELESIEYNANPDQFITIGYAFVPENLFENNLLLSNIEGIFKNSEFEGYLPENLFENNSQLQIINNFIYNCKILPQKIDSIYTFVDNPKIYKWNNKVSPYIFIPNNFIKSNNSRIEIDNLFTFKLMVIKPDSNINYRLYLMSNLSLGGRTTNNINLVVDNKSTIVDKWYQNDSDNSWYLINDFDTYINTANPIFGYINLCININDENQIESEGIEDLKLFNQLSPRSCLVNSELSNVYYGYVFTPSTLIYSIDLMISKDLLFVECADSVNYQTNNHTQKLSPHLILPSIIYKTDINSGNDIFPIYWNSDKRIAEIENHLKLNSIFKVNSNGQLINQNQIDISCIDKFTTSYQTTVLTDTENNITYTQFKFTAIYNNEFTYSKVYDNKSDLSLDISYFESKFNTEVKQELKLLIYSNYLLLFNSWYRGIITQTIDEYHGSCSLNTQYTYQIIDDQNNPIMITALDDNTIKLYPQYIINCIWDETNNIYYFDSAQAVINNP